MTFQLAHGQLNIKNERFKTDTDQLDPDCSCQVCQKYSRHYIRHLVNVGEYTGGQLISYHNLAFYLSMVKSARKAILAGQFDEFYTQFYKNYMTSRPIILVLKQNHTTYSATILLTDYKSNIKDGLEFFGGRRGEGRFM